MSFSITFRLLIFGSLLCRLAAAQVDESHLSEYRQEVSQGDRALQERDYESAKKHYARASEMAHERSLDAMRGLAWADLRLEDAKSALDHAQAALGLATGDAERGEIHNLMGAIFYSEFASDKDTEKLRSSEREFREAIRLGPRQAGAYFNLGKDLLKESQDKEGVEMLQKYLKLAPDAPNAAEVRRLIANPRLSRGEMAPNFSLPDTKGGLITLEALRGRIVLLDFWASWCGPCVASLPEIRKLAGDFPKEQFVLIGVNEDEDAGAWTRFLDQHEMPWPQTRDQDWALFHRFGLAPERKIVVPAYVIIDGEGLILFKARGLEDASSLAKQVRDAMAQKAH